MITQVNEAKEFIRGVLEAKGFKHFAPRQGKGDFQILSGKKQKRISVSVMEKSELINSLVEIAEEIKNSILGGCELTIETDRAYFSNENWLFDGENTSASGPADSPPAKKNKLETSLVFSEEWFNTTFLRLGHMADRYETILDQYTLNKMSTEGLLGLLFDRLKEAGIKIYTADVPITIGEGAKLVIPHITKEAFIAAGIKAIKTVSKT